MCGRGKCEVKIVVKHALSGKLYKWEGRGNNFATNIFIKPSPSHPYIKNGE
jgi:hypothetical protein